MTAAPTVEVIIHPVCLRFRLDHNEIVYFFASNPDQQLDRMEQMLGIEPGDAPIFRTNLGFLPVASTVLIRGEKTILVDPGNHHIGSYSILWQALNSRGLSFEDIDMVVLTHCHSDHAASVLQLEGKPWILGVGELDEMAAIEGGPIVAAKRQMMGPLTEIDCPTEIMFGVTALQTPGHTRGHISLMVESAEGRVLVAGDQTMTRSEYMDRDFSHWYGPEALATLNRSLDIVQGYRPYLVIPGHDRPFRP
jgi:glyoxylase-like metal-dependent hydrolase (beta-lactamase superfamily II)